MMDTVLLAAAVNYRKMGKRRWKSRWIVVRQSGVYLYHDEAEYVVLKIIEGER